MANRKHELDTLTDEGRRLGVDQIFARIEDDLTRLSHYRPLNESEAGHLHEIADLLTDLANETLVKGR